MRFRSGVVGDRLLFPSKGGRLQNNRVTHFVFCVKLIVLNEVSRFPHFCIVVDVFEL